VENNGILLAPPFPKVEKNGYFWLHLSQRWKKTDIFGSTFPKGGKN
jgi:hypothetical protein